MARKRLELDLFRVVVPCRSLDAWVFPTTPRFARTMISLAAPLRLVAFLCRFMPARAPGARRDQMIIRTEDRLLAEYICGTAFPAFAL